MKRHSIITISLLLLMCISVSPLITFAANSDYLYPEKWDDNSRVVSTDIRKKNPENNLYGVFSYVIDNDITCLYTKISVNETSLNYDDSDDIRVSYRVNTGNETYTFSLLRDGSIEEAGESSTVFNTDQNIYIDGNRAEAISYVQYLGNSQYCKFTVYLYVNNCRYLIADDIKVVKPVTTKKPSTTKTKTTKRKVTTSKRTTSRVYKGDNVKTTKFDAEFSKMPENESSSNLTDEVSEAKEDITINKVSRNKLYILIAAAILFILGLLIVVYNAAYISAGSKKEDISEEKENIT